MNKKLYKLMNWPEIEEIVYSDGNDPHRILGAHKVGNSYLVQAFRPDAERISVLIGDGKNKKNYEMELADESGFFAALIPYSKGSDDYKLEIADKSGDIFRIRDPYSFDPTLTREDAIKFSGAVHYSIYDKLGAHVIKRDGIEGVNFCVWAPFVSRVSVVGDFNNFDGRVHQMRMSDAIGLFEIFIPGLGEGAVYKYEIKTHEGNIFLKADPFATELSEEDRSLAVVGKPLKYNWTDNEWLLKRKEYSKRDAKLAICELSLEKFNIDHGGMYDYESIADILTEYLVESNFNAVELTPVQAHMQDDPYSIQGYFAVDSALGTAKQFAKLVDRLHKADIRVLLDFPATFFSKDNPALKEFIGSPLYEYGDSRGFRKGSEYIVFDYGRKEVQNYLLSSALYWLDTFHIDGLRLPDISKILYLDYDKQAGEWTPNIYGGSENLEADEFIRALNTMVFKKDPGLLMICKETANYPSITGSLAEGGLGFDFKWNNGWSGDFFSYIKIDPLFRASQHNVLTFSMIYQYTERFVLAFSHEDIGGLKPMLDMMPGEDWAKAANARFAIAYLYLHPGRKMIYRGFSDFKGEGGKHIGRLIREMNRLYLENPALFAADDVPEGFEWINSIASEDGYMAFVRSDGNGEYIYVVCNMAGIDRDLKIGTSRDGRYYEILNTDQVRYGGSGQIYRDIPIEPVHSPRDEREYTLNVHIAALSIIAFRYEPYTEEELTIRAIRHETHDAFESEKFSIIDLLEAKRIEEEEKVLLELRARYEEEIKQQEIAISEKYAKEEEKRINEVLFSAQKASSRKNISSINDRSRKSKDDPSKE